MSTRDTVIMGHNILKAHGRAVQEIRKRAKRPVKVGFAPTCGMTIPATESKEDIEAAREYLFAPNPEESNWTWTVAWFSDPVFLGHYPENGLDKYGKYLPKDYEKDIELIHQPLDFMCENIYNAVTIKAGADGKPEYVDRKPGADKTAANWPVTPECLYWGPRFLCERYKLPFYISENGLSCHDMVSADGKVHDPNRIEFTRRYLKCLKRAADEGYDICGYFHWSLMDNFEWSCGYSERFGMVYVDYQTQERIPKDSAWWYKELMQKNGENLD